MKRVTMLVCTALVIAACGTGASPIGTSQPPDSTTTSASTPTTSPQPSTTTTSASATTTTSSATPTTQPVVSPTMMDVAPWFFIDEPGRPTRSGPFLVPIYRKVPHTKAIARASLEALFAGPTDGEQNGIPRISTTIPDDVEVLGLTIGEGIAIVDLSSEFEGTDDSPVVAQRMAQVVFTLTSIPHVNEVLFHQEGSPIPAQVGDGQLVTRPVLKADYLDFAAAITVETPVYGGSSDDPMRVLGFAAAFEATFQFTLTDGDGLIIAEGTAMTTNGTGWGGFDFTIDYDIEVEQLGALIVWAYSAEDGSQIDVREYPVYLEP